jgi:hypothetical protein
MGLMGEEREDTTVANKDVPLPPVIPPGMNNVMTRLTFSLSDTGNVYKLVQSKNAKKYDILSVYPTNLTALQCACQQLDIDIIQFRSSSSGNSASSSGGGGEDLLTRVPRKMLLVAARRGVCLDFSPFIHMMMMIIIIRPPLVTMTACFD